MSAAGIYIDIDGQPTDLSEVSWYEKPPCGCSACGATVAFSDYGKGPARIIATAQQAIEEFWETRAIREKYLALGFTVFPDRLDRVRDLLVMQCPHQPRFGVPPRPQVDGYRWAAVHDAISRPKLMHLVTDLAIENAQERRYGVQSAPLCGGKAHLWWSTEWYALDEKVECSRCVAKAHKMEAAR